MLRIQALFTEDWTEDIGRKVADWAAVFEYEILRGFDYNVGPSSDRASLEMARGMARTWGAYLAGLLGRVFRCREFYQAMGDTVVIICRQLPPRLLIQTLELLRHRVTGCVRQDA